MKRKYMVFLKSGCILDVQVDIKSTPFDISEYLKPSSKLLIAETEAVNKKTAIKRVAKATGFEEEQLTACEMLSPKFSRL